MNWESCLCREGCVEIFPKLQSMAEEVVDEAIHRLDLTDKVISPCVTRKLPLTGAEGWHPELHIDLMRKAGIATDVALHLSHTYGGEAWSVLDPSEPAPTRLHPDFPFLQREVDYACSREYAQTVVDVIARRVSRSIDLLAWGTFSMLNTVPY